MRTLTRGGGPTAQRANGIGRDPTEPDDDEIQGEKLPEKPELPIGQERQRDIVLQINAQARIAADRQISRIHGDRDQDQDAECEGKPKPAQAIADETPASLALQARPHEQAGQEEHQRHQKDVLPGAKKIEAKPAVTVDDRKRAPQIGRFVEARRTFGNPLQVGQDRMEGENDQNDDGAQIMQRPARARHGNGVRHLRQFPRPAALMLS